MLDEGIMAEMVPTLGHDELKELGMATMGARVAFMAAFTPPGAADMEPEPEPGPEAGSVWITVECPDDAGPGDTLEIEYGGREIDVEIPGGVAAGDEFQVEPAEQERVVGELAQLKAIIAVAATVSRTEPEPAPEVEPEPAPAPEPEPEVEPEPVPDENAFLAELLTLKPSQLRKRAAGAGVYEAALDESMDSDDPKAALVKLLLLAQAEPEWQLEPEPQRNKKAKKKKKKKGSGKKKKKKPQKSGLEMGYVARAPKTPVRQRLVSPFSKYHGGGGGTHCGSLSFFNV